MAGMDVFKADAFSMMSMLAAIEEVDFNPQFLGSLALFEPAPQRTNIITVESRENVLSLIQTSELGAPVAQRSADKAKLRDFRTVRIAKGSQISSAEIQGIRAFGSETEMKQVQEEVARRLNQLVADVELTWENHRLGAVQGIVTDADGTTIVDFFSEFGVTQPTEVDFDFSALTDGDVRTKIEASITRPMIRAAKGAFVTGSRIIALVGDTFWDEFVNHSEIRTTFLNHQAAAALRDDTAFGTFRYAGVDWVNYRGTDDNTTVSVAAAEAKFFPANAPGVFKVAWGPAESIDLANMPGAPLRSLVLPDTSGRNAFVDVEVYSYPLYVCTRPLTLRRAKRI